MGFFSTKIDGDNYDNYPDYHIARIVTVIAIALIAIIAISMWVMPQYGVWSKELKGKAELKQAQWNKQIMIETAQANLEAEKLNAKSEDDLPILEANPNR